MILNRTYKTKLTQIKVQFIALFSKFVGKAKYIVAKQKHTSIKT